MDVTNIPENVRDTDEEPPDFTAWDAPGEVLTGGSTRERMLDVIVQLHDPAKVSTIAARVECDTETARDYLEWFESMGMVREIAGRPVMYERNDSYLRWRRVERIREQYSEEAIVEALSATMETITEYRERFDAESPDAVSLVNADHGDSVEEVWEALSDWKTLAERAALLDAARRDETLSSGSIGRVDA